MAKLNDLRVNDWVTTIAPAVRYYGQVIGIGNEFVRVRWVDANNVVLTKWAAPDQIRRISPLELLAFQSPT
jgi:hypothetical protein